MGDGTLRTERVRSSRQRYRAFVQDYKQRRLDDRSEAEQKRREDSTSPGEKQAEAGATRKGSGKRREYLREYMRWLWPHRYAVAALLLFALLCAGLEMISPLFMRFMIDRVLLNAKLDAGSRLGLLHWTGGLFLGVVVLSTLIGALKDYRQRVLNTRVMLTLRRALFERLLHLPLPKLWDFKTGGILSRLTGDVDTTTGLLQLAVVSPTLSVVRLMLAMRRASCGSCNLKMWSSNIARVGQWCASSTSLCLAVQSSLWWAAVAPGKRR
jgi:ATP-binding cassette, subfamily B, bacterial